MKVLYLNHTGLMSGAERSLLELLAVLPEDESGFVACPEGPFAVASREHGMEVFEIPGAETGLRLHPIQTPISVAGMVRSALTVGRLARREQADLIHANSVRAGLVAGMARRFGAPPAVVYVHDCLPATRIANQTRRSLISRGSVILTNSHYTTANFAAGNQSADVRTVYYGMVDGQGDLVSLGSTARPGRAESRLQLGFNGRGPLLGLVAQITPWKGQDTAIRALVDVRREHPEARLLLVGEAKFLGKGTRFDNADYFAGLRRLIRELDLGEAVSFLGERSDALRILAALDLLIAPSWEEPFGRTIVEAMALGTPVVATAVGGPAEIVEDGVSGRLVSPRRPELLAAALLDLLGNHEKRGRMADAGRVAARRFNVEQHLRGIASAYSDAVDP